MKTAVLGGGPVGLLTAIMLNDLGFDVDVYDKRPNLKDLSPQERSRGTRSYNLALSDRGFTAIEAIEPSLSSLIKKRSIPLLARQIHYTDGSLKTHKYSVEQSQAWSLSRELLGLVLIEAIEKKTDSHRIKLHWLSEVQNVDVPNAIVHFTIENGESRQETYDFIIACDGAFSRARESMSRVLAVDYSQKFAAHAFRQINLPANKTDDELQRFKMHPNCFHIWPRHDHLLFASGNEDGTFTTVLCTTPDCFEKLHSEQSQVKFFRKYFPDYLELFGEQNLEILFREKAYEKLITVDISPLNYENKLILLGDAAHAMYPFYGQGLNCGLEDVRLLKNLFVEYGISPNNQSKDLIKKAFQTYNTNRLPDLSAIDEYTERNYHELMGNVVSMSYRCRRSLDNMLHKMVGNYWLPLYHMVVFRPDMTYSQVKAREIYQNRILNFLGIGICAAAIAYTSRVIYSLHK